MMKYRDIYSVRLQLLDISLRHASNQCAPQMIKLAVATARLMILDRLVYFKIFQHNAKAGLCPAFAHFGKDEKSHLT